MERFWSLPVYGPPQRGRSRRRLLCVLVPAVLSCQGGAGEPGREVGGAPGGAEADPQGALYRLAPAECPPDIDTGDQAPWTEADTVALGGGRSLELQGCRSAGDAWITFTYDGPASVAPYHLIQAALYEGREWLLLHGGSGRWWPVAGRPEFSPDGAWFATTAVDLDAGYLRNHVDMWALEGDSVRRTLALDGDSEWGASDLRWVSTDRVEYLRIGLLDEPEGGRWLDSTRATLVLRPGEGWVPEPNR